MFQNKNERNKLVAAPGSCYLSSLSLRGNISAVEVFLESNESDFRRDVIFLNGIIAGKLKACVRYFSLFLNDKCISSLFQTKYI